MIDSPGSEAPIAPVVPAGRCKNCERTTSPADAYCSGCGQRLHIARFTTKSVLRNALAQVFNFDRGLGHNIVMLFKNPGKMIRDIASGRTQSYTNIFRMTVILVAVCTVALVSSDIYEKQQEAFGHMMIEDEAAFQRQMQSQAVVKEYLNVLFLSLIPFLALANFWLTRKRALNYAEHLMVAAVQIVGATLVTTVLQLLGFFVIGVNVGMSGVILVLSFAYHAYVLWSTFPNMRWYGAAWRSLVSYLIAFSLLMIIGLIVMAIFLFAYAAIYGGEELKALFPQPQ